MYYGCDYSDRDFLYRDEIVGMPTLDLHTAFWKEENVFVQQRMLENSKELYKAVMDGSVFYVCGHVPMGNGVHKTLKEIIAKEGNKTMEQAHEMVIEMINTRRYQSEVFE